MSFDLDTVPSSAVPVIVVGGGQSGLAAARALRELRMPAVVLAPAGGSRVDRLAVEGLRDEPAGQVLPADRGGQEAATGRAVQVEFAGENHQPRDAAGVGREKCDSNSGGKGGATPTWMTKLRTTWRWTPRSAWQTGCRARKRGAPAAATSATCSPPRRRLAACG